MAGHICGIGNYLCHQLLFICDGSLVFHKVFASPDRKIFVYKYKHIIHIFEPATTTHYIQHSGALGLNKFPFGIEIDLNTRDLFTIKTRSERSREIAVSERRWKVRRVDGWARMRLNTIEAHTHTYPFGYNLHPAEIGMNRLYVMPCYTYAHMRQIVTGKQAEKGEINKIQFCLYSRHLFE